MSHLLASAGNEREAKGDRERLSETDTKTQRDREEKKTDRVRLGD